MNRLSLSLISAVTGAVLLLTGAAMRGYAQWHNAQTERRLLENVPRAIEVVPHTFTPADAAPSRIRLPDLGLWNTLEPVSLGQGAIWQTSDAGWHRPNDWRGWPGHGGNVVVAGHSPARDPAVWAHSVFRQLAYLAPGERIELSAGSRTYYYRVAHVFAIPESQAETPAAAAWIARGGAERLTLVTCWPPHTAAYRVIVIALPTSVTNLEKNP